MSLAHKSLRERAEEAKAKVLDILGVDDHSHDEEMVKAIEAIIIEALLEERERCATVAYDHCCAEDRDMAHKVADEIKRIRTALVANLDSLR
ncbi:hypothetical protein V5T82_06125 [Magnetovibrio sp. PR-2]|uniref:hypothetical protein n=1 Tax=Magnetovibrio sp. PR-2 TaxID=3120356 RepID=UPI002FCDEE0C